MKTTDEERNEMCAAEGVDGFIHTYRTTDDAIVAKISVCGKVARRGPAEDHMRMCHECGIWMLRWAGSKDPEGEWAKLCADTKR